MIIAVLLIAAVTAIIASLLLTRSVQEQKLAARAQASDTAFALAEAGLDQAIQALNNSWLTSTHGWSDATDGTAKIKSVTSGLPIFPGTGSFYVRIDDPTGTNPQITALGLVALPNQANIIRQLRVKVTPRTEHAAGVVCSGTISLLSNSYADSYDSSLGPYDVSTNRSDQAFIGTTSSTAGALSFNSFTYVYGYVGTGGPAPATPSNHLPNVIYGATTTTTAKVDPARVRTDFVSSFPPIPSTPTGTAIALGSVSASTSLPRSGDTPGTNGRYLYNAASITLSGVGDSIGITGNVDLIVTGDISMNQDSTVTVSSSGAGLRLFAGGDITLNASSKINYNGRPINVIIYGTSTTGTQKFRLNNDSQFYGTVIAPNSDLEFINDGVVCGAAIGKTAQFNATSAFHYDTSLNANPSAYVRLSAWVELAKPAASGLGLARDNRQPFGSLVN